MKNMKKIFVVSAIALGLASCSVTSTPTDYTSLYNANVKAEMAKMDETFKLIYPSQEVVGKLSAFAEYLQDGTNTGSFSFESDYNVVANGNSKAEFNFNNPTGKFSATNSGALATIDYKADKFALVSNSAKTWMSYVNPSATASVSDAEIQKALQDEINAALEKAKNYAGKWIDLTQTGDDYQMSDEQLDLIAKVSALTPADLEKYLTTYHIATATGTVTQNGTKYKFPVEFNQANTIALIDAISKDFSGSGLTDEAKKDVAEVLSTIVVENAFIEFDSKDPLYSVSSMTFSNSENPGMKIVVDASRISEKLNFSLALQNEGKEMGKLTFDSTTSGKNTDFVAKVTADMGDGSQSEILNFSGKVEDKILKNLKGTLSAVIAAGTLEYTHKDKLLLSVSTLGEKMLEVSNQFTGDNFAGKAILRGTEIANWTLEITSDKLTGLALTVQDISLGTPAEKPLLAMNLVKQENSDMIGGAISLATAGQDMASAKIQLQAEKEKFGIIIEDIKATDEMVTASIPLKKFQFFATGKTSETSKNIELPKESVSVAEFEKTLGIERFSVVDMSALEEELPAIDNSSDLDESADIDAEVVPADAPMYPTTPLN